MTRPRTLFLAAALTLGGALGAAVASPAQDLFDQTLNYLDGYYGGFSTADVKGFRAKYQPELNAACPAPAATCPYSASVPVIKKLLTELDDPHSGYYTPDGYAAYLRSSQGQGAPKPRIGVVTIRAKDSADRLVTDVVEGAPAELAGLKRGDRITAVDGVPLPSDDEANVGAISARVELGGPVTLTVRRGALPAFTVTLTGELQKTSRMPSLKVRDDGVAVLRIPDFAAGQIVGPRVHDLVREAERAGASVMVVDLRDNPGGRATECLSGVSAFVKDVTRFFQYRDSREEEGYRAGAVYSNSGGREYVQYKVARPAFWSRPLAVLVNENSASCSEYFASDVQFARRGLIIGEPTRGVGNTGIYVLPLLDGSGLSVTAFKALRADGSPYPARVMPDVEVKDDLEALAATGRDGVLEAALERLRTAEARR